MTAPGAASGPAPVSLAEAMIATLKSRRVRFLFGVPGGGSSLDLIAAADEAGIEFILCRGETAAALMASVAGQLSATPGVVLTAIGPGAASAVNGVAYAHLERAALLLICDSHDGGKHVPPHQVFDLQALFSPIAKACERLALPSGAPQFDDLVALALRPPEGPILVELSPADAGRSVPPGAAAAADGSEPHVMDSSDGELDKASALLAGSRRPILLIGLQACMPAIGAALLRFAERLGCPVMTSYKAKGVVADSHFLTIGHLTGADGEAEAIRRADLILWAGIEPVELISTPWRHAAPLLALSDRAGLEYPVAPAAQLIGPLRQGIEALSASCGRSEWARDEIAEFRDALAQRLRLAGGEGHTAESVVDAVTAAAGDDTRFAVDAGAHMISIMARIQAPAAQRVLKSTGLSTMGFAVPAAIASALVEPERRCIAFTGDGGLLMCLAELSTAARLGCRLTVIVLNDAQLSLIDLKQQRRQHQPLGARYPAVDFASAAASLGCRAWNVGLQEPLQPALEAALAHDGAGLIDIAVDASGYGDQLAALRG